ncbi:Hsp70 family protein [Labedaea rhizosphaerae]|uniref:Hsp70 protein n=1 Tax=Labedaea rhizosphaerae TaxID=598644 RepID=A0A4V3CYZ1_LABRH|nr:Hsp70 family protein [Labedaea rhizosphaerae]TDP96028.1 Hsp70 protein [Labedaea rhizosphaerae]
MTVLSVDLGTSNTVAVLSAHGMPPRVVELDGASMMPSAVFAAEAGTLVVGKEAERRARTDPARYEPNPKRRVDEGTLLLGDAVVPVTDAFAAVLRRIATEVKRQLGGAVPDEVRLTHPAQWGPVRRNVLLSAARQAGFGPNLVLVPEPVAAAAHFASFPSQDPARRNRGEGQALAVYDLGAGTFDVAVVGATQQGYVVLAEAGLADLGGLDVDQALLEHIGRQVASRDPVRWQRVLRPESTVDRRAQRALREDIRAGKEALSTHPQTEIALPEPFDEVLVTRAELEELITVGLLRSVELMAATIRSAGLSPDRLAGIYLVGGSSRIPLVATLIARHLGVVPINLDQPETAVARGALHVSANGVSLRTGTVAPPAPRITRPQVPQPVHAGWQQSHVPPPQPQQWSSPPSPPLAIPIPQSPPRNPPTALVAVVYLAAALCTVIGYWPTMIAGILLLYGAGAFRKQGKGIVQTALGALITTVFVALLVGLRETATCLEYTDCHGDAIDQSNLSGWLYSHTHFVATFYGTDTVDVLARCAAALLALAALAVTIGWRRRQSRG